MDLERAGAAIRRERSRIYGTRETFANACGVSISVLSDLERGVRSNFDVDTIGRVEDALGWAPGSYEAVAEGKRVRRSDPLLAKIQQAWPKLSRDEKAMIADLAELAAERRRR